MTTDGVALFAAKRRRRYVQCHRTVASRNYISTCRACTNPADTPISRRREDAIITSALPKPRQFTSHRSQRAQSSDTSNCSRSDIGRRLGAGADPVADSGPGGQLLAEAPVIPALRVPARELARRPGEPAAAERHPGRGASTAPRIPRDTDAVDAASGPEHTGDHPRAQFRHQ